MNTGKLYIVATPIGNLKDISFRAIDVLKSVDLIAAEDTRHASILCKEYEILTKRISYYDEIEDKRTAELVKLLKDGKDIALISDAGTPGINDPGYRVIAKAVRENIDVIPIPGASSVLAALVCSGLPTDRFVYEGFLPKKKGRQTRMLELAEEPRTIVILESPFRIIKTLNDIKEYLGERDCAVGREMTKIYEEFVRGKVTELIQHFTKNKPKGEFVIIVEGLTRKKRKS